MLDDTYDVEAIGNDAGIRKLFSDDATVGAAEVDADYFDSLPAFETGEKGISSSCDLL